MTIAMRKPHMIVGIVVAAFLLGACSTTPRAGGETSQAAGRQMFSPDVHGDPYTRTQWEVSVQALEAECRRSGKLCQEAAQARIAISRKRSRG